MIRLRLVMSMFSMTAPRPAKEEFGSSSSSDSGSTKVSCSGAFWSRGLPNGVLRRLLVCRIILFFTCCFLSSKNK